MRIGTICFFLLTDTHILFAMKKVGFGAGKWNGLGGKVRDGETVAAAAVREIQEEGGSAVDESALEKVAELTFFFAGKLEWVCHAFLVRAWHGEPRESGEMQPRWFDLTAIPFGEMWVDDQHWLPLVLAGTRIKGEGRFDASGEVLEGFIWREVSFSA